jgi:hypothetical protein
MDMRCDRILVGLAAACVAVAVSGPMRAHAQGDAPPLAAVELDGSQTIRDNLSRLATAKKGVEVVLKSGKSYRGVIGSVGPHAIVLTQLEGREFYDALVDLEEIAAIEVRVRASR